MNTSAKRLRRDPATFIARCRSVMRPVVGAMLAATVLFTLISFTGDGPIESGQVCRFLFAAAGLLSMFAPKPITARFWAQAALGAGLVAAAALALGLLGAASAGYGLILGATFRRPKAPLQVKAAAE